MSIPEDSASTRLNSTVVPDGETLQDWDQPQADLVVDPEELRAMGEDAHALSRILTAGPQASRTTYSAAAALSNDGFATGSALHHTGALLPAVDESAQRLCARRRSPHRHQHGTCHP